MAEKRKSSKNESIPSDLIVVSDILPDKPIIIPLVNRPIFPGVMLPLTFSGEKFIKSLETAYERDNQLFGTVFIKKVDNKDFFNSELHDMGTILKIIKITPVGENTIQVLVQGLQRFSLISQAWKDPVLRWKVKYHYEPDIKPSDELKAYTMSIMSALKELLKINQIFQEQLKMLMSQLSYDRPGHLLDLVVSILNADPLKLQEVLETLDLIERSEKILILLKEELELTHIQQDIEKQIEEKVNKRQKEYFLQEQLKVIKKELGLEKDDKAAEIEKLEKRIKNLILSDEASKVIEEEMDKLKMLPNTSPEFHVTRNYLNVLTELPWGIFSKDRLNIKQVRKILDEDHFGLQDVKKLILEFIATIIKRGKVTGSILCLVGPPGVGKTSIGKSIARSLNRQFYRFSLGGMRDEAEIKGHRRTYIGAMPGKIIQSLKRTGSSNPVIMLDEIDKIGMSYMGDPASALLEVLDPEQNKDFLDHYLDVRFDLSNILFVTTANQLDTIPRPLLDRMEIIKLPGYIMEEKVEIAKRYLIPRQRKRHGLKASEIKITDPALKLIADGYAREAGVRNMENNIKKIMRQITLQQAEGSRKKFSVNNRNLEEFLGKPLFSNEDLYQKKIPGVTLGLAWTSMGGTTLYIEASGISTRNPGFKQTGQLGKVMLESSEIAYSYIRTLLNKDKTQKNYFSQNFIHLHVPEGATPKDGPSAGITIALALYSLATAKPVTKKIAMTGELTLTGKVLPIGGIREKIIAARRVGVYELIVPKANEKDFVELPDYIKEGITIHYADFFPDVLKYAY
ncbi:endopeptidase La [Candidatus Cloacimonadota bacterium]